MKKKDIPPHTQDEDIGPVLSRRKVIALCCLFSLASGAAFAHAESLACPLLKLRSIAISEETEEEVLRAVGPDREAPPRLTASPASHGEVALVALGPVLDSLDSHEIEVTPACTADGGRLVVAITHHPGGVLKNVRWRPRIRVALSLARSPVVFQTTWKMRRPDGSEIDRVGAQRYPVTVMTTLRPRG